MLQTTIHLYVVSSTIYKQSMRMLLPSHCADRHHENSYRITLLSIGAQCYPAAPVAVVVYEKMAAAGFCD